MATGSSQQTLQTASNVLATNKALRNEAFLWNAVKIKPGTNNTRKAAQDAREIQNKNEAITTNNIESANSTQQNSVNYSEYESSNNAGDYIYAMVPTGGGINGNYSDYLVDVVNNYSWTMSPKESRTYAPYIHLREMQTIMGAELQKLLYTLSAAADSTINTGSKATDTIKNITTKITSNSAITDVANSAFNKVTNIFGNINEYKDKLNSEINSQLAGAGANVINFNTSPHLKPYAQLYRCVETGWQYKFPYFGDNVMDTKPNRFGEPSGSIISVAQGLIDVVNKYGGGFEASISNFTGNEQRNTEQSMMYAYDKEGLMFDVKFPLLNTIDTKTAADNYRLVELLKYQSRPYRVSRNMIVPINIYEVCVPGVKYIPYAFIRDFKVEFKGVRHTAWINVLIDNKSVSRKVIIPEVYDITISIQSLTNESQNFMIESLLDSRKFITK